MTDPLPTCPVCTATGTAACRALDHAALPTPHAERTRLAPSTAPTPLHAAIVIRGMQTALASLIALGRQVHRG